MKQLLCCSDSDTGSFNGFLQFPIRPNSIFPFSVVYGIMGWGLLVCMYLCIHVCISMYMYVLCMYYPCIIHTYVCMYACIQIQIKFITHATLHRNVNLRRGIIYTGAQLRGDGGCSSSPQPKKGCHVIRQ